LVQDHRGRQKSIEKYSDPKTYLPEFATTGCHRIRLPAVDVVAVVVVVELASGFPDLPEHFGQTVLSQT